jgi:hypothetical protein
MGTKTELVSTHELDTNTNNDLVVQLDVRITEVEDIILATKEDIETKNG